MHTYVRTKMHTYMYTGIACYQHFDRHTVFPLYKVLHVNVHVLVQSATHSFDMYFHDCSLRDVCTVYHSIVVRVCTYELYMHTCVHTHVPM